MSGTHLATLLTFSLALLSIQGGRSQSDPNSIQFVTKPAPFIEAEINTTIILFWQIQYESCSQVYTDCFQVDLHITFKNKTTFYPVTENVTVGELLFDAAMTKSVGSTDTSSSYANVRAIMFIDEYVENNVESLNCTAILLKSNPTSNSSMHSIRVIHKHISPTPEITSQVPHTSEPVSSMKPCTSQSVPTVLPGVVASQISPTQLPCTCAPAKALVSNSVLVVCSPILVILLGFFQLLQLHPIVSYC